MKMTSILEGLDLGEDPTNIERLHPDLQPYVQEDRLFGRVLKHPMVFQVPFFSWKMANHAFEVKSEELAEAMRGGDYHRVMFIYERPYRIPALIRLWATIPQEQKKELLQSIWTDTEFPSDQFPLRTIVKMFRSVGFFSDDGSPQPSGAVTIYRGVGAAKYRKGISWTLSQERGKWFAKRFRGIKPGIVYVAEIDPSDVLAIFHSRGEDEVVVDPNGLQNIRKMQ